MRQRSAKTRCLPTGAAISNAKASISMWRAARPRKPLKPSKSNGTALKSISRNREAEGAESARSAQAFHVRPRLHRRVHGRLLRAATRRIEVRGERPGESAGRVPHPHAEG